MVKNLPANARDTGDSGLIPGSTEDGGVKHGCFHGQIEGSLLSWSLSRWW